MPIFPLVFLVGCALVWVVVMFEREDAEFSPSMLLLSLLLVAFILRQFIRAHS